MFEGAWQYLLLVRDEMTVAHKHLSEFCSSLKQYLKSVAGERDCFQWVPWACWGGGGGHRAGAAQMPSLSWGHRAWGAQLPWQQDVPHQLTV